MLGLAVGDTLEVTQCFPIASVSADEEIPEDEQIARARDDTITMMTLLRTVNVDSNSVRTHYNAGGRNLASTFLSASQIASYPLRSCSTP